MILEEYFPEDIRVSKETKALLKDGYEVYLLCMRRKNEKPFETMENGLNIIRVELPSKQSNIGLFYRAINAFIFNHPLWQKEIEKFLIKYKIDILHVHDLPLFGTTNRVAKKHNKKIIVDLHENYPDGLQVWSIWRKDFKSKYIYPILSNYARWLRFEKFACEKADKIIVVVKEMQERLKKKHDIDLSKVTIVSNTEEKEFASLAEDERIIKEFKNKFIVSYIGGVGYHRGIDTTIKAFNKINNENITLMIVGGMNSDIKKHLDKITTNTNIIYTGQVPFEKVFSYIKASQICLVPHNNTEHTNHTVPHKLFQYMLAKRAVLVSDCKPLKRIVEESNSGLIFKANDHEDMKNKIDFMYNNPEVLKESAISGFHYANEINNFEKDALSLCNLYKEIK